MKRKIILSHFISLLLSFSLMLTLVCISVDNVNRKNTENSIRSNLYLTREVFNQKRLSNTRMFSIVSSADTMKASNSDIRLTFLDKDGDVLYDNDEVSQENHLERPEIQHLGTLYYRHSDTLNIDMVYLATYLSSDAIYIRIAMPLKSMNSLIYQIILGSSLSMIIILIMVFFFDYFFIDKELRPLKEGSQKLSRLVSLDPNETKNEIESITESINVAEKLIQEKVDDLTEEKEKLNYIISTMSQGLVILDSKENILLLNLTAEKIFHVGSVKTLSKLTVIPELYTLYHHALENREENVVLIINDRRYLVSTHPIGNVWVREGEKGCSLLFVDVSEAQRLETAKKDFFANASHELKSPLTSILGYTQMIKEGFLTEKSEVEDALSKIQSEGKRMNEIIIGMLELSRLESEDREEDPEENSLREILEEEIRFFEVEAMNKKIDVNVSGSTFPVYGPREDLLSLVKNLLENAIRYNVEGGRVGITLTPGKRTLRITDTGIGIPKEDQERIFERFYRVDKARSRKLGGTGLGLSIVKHICNNNGITLRLESEVNKGTTFLLTFPTREELTVSGKKNDHEKGTL